MRHYSCRFYRFCKTHTLGLFIVPVVLSACTAVTLTTTNPLDQVAVNLGFSVPNQTNQLASRVLKSAVVPAGTPVITPATYDLYFYLQPNDNAGELVINFSLTQKMTQQSSSVLQYVVGGFLTQDQISLQAINQLAANLQLSFNGDKTKILPSQTTGSNFAIAPDQQATYAPYQVEFVSLIPNNYTGSVTANLVLSNGIVFSDQISKTITGFKQPNIGDSLGLMQSSFLFYPNQTTNAKNFYDQYTSGLNNTEASFAPIRSNPAALATGAALETKKTDSTTNTTKVLNILNTPNSPTFSQLEALTADATDLGIYLINLARVVFYNTTVTGIDQTTAKGYLKSILEKYLNDYWYGLKAGMAQNVYKSWFFYEDRAPEILILLANALKAEWTTTDWLWFQTALDYFIPNAALLGAAPSARYVLANPPTVSQNNNSAARALKYVSGKILAAAHTQDGFALQETLNQFSTGMDLNPITTTSTNQFSRVWANNNPNAQSNYGTLLTNIETIRKLVEAISQGEDFVFDGTKTLNHLSQYAIGVLFKTVITPSNIDNDTYLKLVGSLTAIARLTNNQPLINAARVLLVDKTTSNLTKYNGLGGHIKTQITGLINQNQTSSTS